MWELFSNPWALGALFLAIAICGSGGSTGDCGDSGGDGCGGD